MPAALPPPPVVTDTDAMAATRADKLPPIDVGAWTRVSGRFQGDNPKKLNDFSMDNAYVELHAGGKIHKKVGVTLNLNANMLGWYGNGVPYQGSLVAVEDAIISFDILDEFHVWGGHLLVPVDRANASGPFFMLPWNYPGFFGGAVQAPREGPSGRNNGLVVWGDISGGKLTYLAGVFDNGTGVTKNEDLSMTKVPGTSPLFSGRVRLALLDPEPGFWGNGSYFGDKDLLSIGVGGQYQKNPMGKDYSEVNADVLFEKKLPGTAFVTAEAAYYHFNVDAGGFNNVYYVLLAYATPTIGIGNIQPMVRYQAATVKGGGSTAPKNLDVGLSYLIKGPALRLVATYSYNKGAGTVDSPADVTANAIQLGAQAIFF